MILTFHCAFKNEYDEVVDSYKDILINYFTGWFFIDFFSTVPLDLLFFILGYENVYSLNLNYDYNKFAKILRFGKLIKFTKLAQVEAWVSSIDLFQIHKNKKIRPSANKVNLIKNINDLIMTLLSLVIVCHTMACSWIFISNKAL